MDYNHDAFPAHLRKGPPRYVERHQRKVAAEKALEACYAQVEVRDKGKCRVTGAYLQPGAVDPKVRREHHHLVKRSQDKLLIDDPANVILVSAEAHRLITDGWLIVEGTDANGVLRFHWRNETPPSVKIITIRSRRRSQHEDEG